MFKTLGQIRDQFSALMSQMQTHQKLTLVVLGLMVLAPFMYLMTARTEGGYEPLQWGAAFDRDILMQAEQVLIDRGFNDFKTVGQRILAPKSKIEEYNAALVAGGIWSPHAATEWEKTAKELTIWTTTPQREELHDIYLRKDIARILRAIDGIQDADVMWARSKTRQRWPNGPTVTATVNITPRAGRDLSPPIVESLRSSVASMIPDLKRENVVILDRSTGRSYAGGDPNAPFDSKLLQYKESVIEDYRSRISGALAYIPEVVVSVNVDFDNRLSSRERRQQVDPKTVDLNVVSKTTSKVNTEATPGGVPGTSSNQPRDLAGNAGQLQSTQKDTENVTQSTTSVTITDTEYIAAEPKAVRAAISVPDSYYEKVAVQEGAVVGTSDAEKADFRKSVDAIRTRETAKIKQAVATLLPTGSAQDSVTVTSHTAIQPEIPKADFPVAETIRDVVSNWGSAAALSVFAIWALLLMKKSTPVSKPAAPTPSLESLANVARPEPPPEPEQEPPPKSPRDYLQVAVQDDPAGAAIVLSKWLQKT